MTMIVRPMLVHPCQRAGKVRYADSLLSSRITKAHYDPKVHPLRYTTQISVLYQGVLIFSLCEGEGAGIPNERSDAGELAWENGRICLNDDSTPCFWLG